MEELVASTLARELKVPHLVARFLVSRGVQNVADAYKFLYGSDSDIADPMLMKGMGEAVEWLLDVQKSGEEIFIFGDYDLDGMTSVTLLTINEALAVYVAVWFVQVLTKHSAPTRAAARRIFKTENAHNRGCKNGKLSASLPV